MSLTIGDCRVTLARWASEGLRVQAVVTSPPYWGLRDYGVDGQLGLEKTPEEYVAQMVEVFRLVRDVLADDGTCWLNLGDSYANDGKWGGSTSGKHVADLHRRDPSHAPQGLGRGKRETGLKPKDLVGIPWRVAFALQADGWWLRSDIIWAKTNCMPESVSDRPTKSHEYLFLLSKRSSYFYDSDAIREPDAGADHPRTVLDGQPSLEPSNGLHAPHRGIRTIEGRNGAGRNRRSVWTIATTPYPDAHFATFPEDLVKPCILAGSRPGDIVLDPFMGSGTVAKVAQDLGRQWLGCELNPAYAGMCERRTPQGGLAL